MKKITIYTLFTLLLCAGNMRAQVLDAPSEENMDHFYEHIHQGKKKPFAYPYVREADVVWQRRVWREIKFSEKLNQFFYYPTQAQQGRISFMEALTRAAQEGRIKIYTNDEFKEETSWAKVQSQNSISRQEEMQDPDDPTNVRDTIIVTHLKLVDIKALRVKEEWYVDKNRTVRDVRILGVGAMVNARDENGNIKGVQELFWIRYADPEVRELLANTQAYNEMNDVGGMSYDDVFVKRYFSSYIYKQMDTQLRSISTYLTGVDALARAAEIENELFNRDEDMWEY